MIRYLQHCVNMRSNQYSINDPDMHTCLISMDCVWSSDWALPVLQEANPPKPNMSLFLVYMPSMFEWIPLAIRSSCIITNTEGIRQTYPLMQDWSCESLSYSCRGVGRCFGLEGPILKLFSDSNFVNLWVWELICRLAGLDLTLNSKYEMLT